MTSKTSKTRHFALLIALAALTLGACGSDDAADAGYRGATKSGTYFVKVATDPAPIPLNDSFAATVSVYDSAAQQALLDDVEVLVDGEMPMHGHGMNVQPAISKRADGSFDVQGMLFHMPGMWKLHVDVKRQSETERVTFDVVLEP